MMAVVHRVSRFTVLLLIVAAGAFLASEAWAGRRQVKSKALNYPDGPVTISHSKVAVIETFPTANQDTQSDSARKLSRIRYANRAGRTKIVYYLEGELKCRNTSRKGVEALGLLIVPLDAFHQPLMIYRRTGKSSLNQVQVDLATSRPQTVKWQERIGSSDAYEVAIAVKSVRFSDGTVWNAPPEELVDIF